MIDFPRWLAVSAFAIVIEALIRLLVEPPNSIRLFGLLIGVIIAYFLLRGSRIAWLIAVAAAVEGLTEPFLINQDVWVVIPSVVVLAGALMPSSLRFVWTHVRGQSIPRGMPDLGSMLREGEYYGLERVSKLPGVFEGWWLRLELRVSLGWLVIICFVAVMILAPFVNAVYDLHHGSHKGELSIDIAWHILWIAYCLIQLGLILLLIVAAHRYFENRRKPAVSAHNREKPANVSSS